MKKLLVLLFSANIGSMIAQCPTSTSFEPLHANQIHAIIPSSNELFVTDNDGGGFLIGNTSTGLKPTIYSSGIWMTGVTEQGFPYSSIQINDRSKFNYTAGPILGNTSTEEECNNWDKVWSVTQEEIATHQLDFLDNGVINQPILSIMAWPGRRNPQSAQFNQLDLPNRDLAPFWDQNKDGIYNPMEGDYPYIQGLEVQPAKITWSIFNDRYSSSRLHFATTNTEIHRTTWAYDCADNPILNNAVFVRYKLVGRNSVVFPRFLFGVYTDFDLGCPSDDFTGTSVPRQAVYAYNADNTDEDCNGSSGFGENPPAQAVAFLNKNLFATYINAAGIDQEFGAPAHNFYNLAGLHDHDVKQTAKGNGYNTDGREIPYSFNGDPWDPQGWSMYQANTSIVNNNVLASVNIGQLIPSDIHTIDLVFLTVRTPGKNHLENVEVMFSQLDSIHSWYKTGFKNLCSATTNSCLSDCVWPGDANADGIANHEDLFSIGLNLGNSGPQRAGTVSWGPKNGDNWSNPTQKHADADGNGTIQTEDILITQLNYNQKTPDYQAPAPVYTSGPELSLRSVISNSFVNMTPGKSILTQVRLTSVPELQGLAFSLEYDPDYFSEISITNNNNASFQIRKVNENKNIGTINNHQLDFARFETDLTKTISASNSLVSFYIKVKGKIGTNVTSDSTWIRFKNIKGIRADGSSIPMGSIDQLAILDKGLVATEPSHELQGIEVFPNPASEKITIVFQGTELDRVQLFNATGSLIKDQTNCTDQLELDIRALFPGFYFLKIEKQGYSTVKKVLIE